jgi:hypothetical protein
MGRRDIELAIPVDIPFFKLQASGGTLSDDNILQRVLALLLIHCDPDNTYTLDGLHPQEVIARTTTGGVDECVERLNIIGSSLTDDLNNDLADDDADPSEAISSISFAARAGERADSPRIVVRILRATGEQLTAELKPYD